MNSYYGDYTRTRSFSDIFEDFNTFKSYWNDGPFASSITANQDLQTIYYVLLANYANSHIVSSDEYRFKLEFISLIFRYAPTWLKKLDLQKKLRALTDDELAQGSKAINNHAFNPGTAPTTGSLEEVEYINEQSSQNFKKSKVDAYYNLYSILEDDVTSGFIYVFKKLFRTVVEPERPLWYLTEEED